MLDGQKKGYLDKDDVKKIFRTNGVRVTEEDLDAAFREADSDGDKKIEATEFIQMMADKMKTASTAEALKEAFKVFDPEDSGLINEKELREALLNIGDPVTNKEVMELEQVAGTQDGNIRYELFINSVFASK